MLLQDHERLKRVQEELKRKMEQRKQVHGAPNPYSQALIITSQYKVKK